MAVCASPSEWVLGPGRDTPDTFSGRDSPGLSGINWDKWDSAGFQGSTGADVTARAGRRGLPSTTSRMAATASGERPFLTGAWPAPGAALAASFAAARSRSRRSLSVPSMRLRTSARRASSAVDTGSSRRLRSARAESQRPQGLDQDEPRPALRTRAERTHPRLVGAVGLLLLADQVAHVLDVAADGRARARAALRPDAGRDLVDGGAVCDGRIDGLAQGGRQPRDGGAPERRGCRGLSGFVLHEAMLARRSLRPPPHHGAYKWKRPRRLRPPGLRCSRPNVDPCGRVRPLNRSASNFAPAQHSGHPALARHEGRGRRGEGCLDHAPTDSKLRSTSGP